jgi:hypothetical protein
MPKLVVLCFLLLVVSCSSEAAETPDAAVNPDAASNPDAAANPDATAPDPDGGSSRTLVLDYTFGSYSGAPNNIYVVWAENAAEGYYQPFAICERLLNGTLTGSDVLPYWHLGAYPEMSQTDVDAVTGATQAQQNLSFTLNLPASAPDRFSLFFETDVSFDPNDWFGDQPAILYQADIDFTDLQASYVLSFVGWTAHSTILAESRAATGNDQLAAGELQTETRFITHHEDQTSPDGFGDPDDRTQTSLVGSLEATPQE